VYLGSYAGTTWRFGGKLDEAQIFGRVLSAQEIVNLQGGVSDTTPPSVPTGLSASGISATGATISWTASTDNVGVTGYKVFRNGTQVGTPASASFTDSGLTASTTYSYTVSAFDAAGNNSAPSVALPVITSAPADTTPPTVPTGLSASGITATGATISWTASTDNVGVTGYKVFRNGTQVGTPASTSFTDSGLTAATTYSYTVSAFDAAGNNSALSSALPVTTSAASASGPVAKWSFEEGTGTVAADSSGNGNSGRCATGWLDERPGGRGGPVERVLAGRAGGGLPEPEYHGHGADAGGVDLPDAGCR
jgi:cellulose 1,4-beta-cellobiosidase